MEKRKQFEMPLPLAIIIAGMMLAGAVIYNNKSKPSQESRRLSSTEEIQNSALEEKVLPSGGVTLPISWGNLGKKLVNAGVIDGQKFRDLYEQRGQFTEEYNKLLFGDNNEKLKITEDNAGYILNLLWALGLSNSNPVLDDPKEMKNPQYGGAGNFASTGGWTMSVGDPMGHYNKHVFFNLTPEQQALVDKVSRGIYRPCCNNSTHFPDCNHGMAMLGLLQLMASQGASEDDIWKAALAVNSYWFPDTYITIASFMKDKGVEWKDVNPQEILGADYSSISGFQKIQAQVAVPNSSRGGSGCGVETGQAPVQQRQQSGCGI